MKKNIAVLMGGYSQEAEISFKSGAVVMEHLDKNIYTPYAVHICKKHWVGVINGKEYPINKDDFSLTVDNQKIKFQAAFNAIHGTPGEDGYLQAYFELIGLPLTGCNMYCSALTFNKRDLLAVLKKQGVRCASSYYINQGDVVDTAAIVKVVGLPCFVKANKSGSSFGVYKVYEEKQLVGAINEALNIDNQVLIEQFLNGREFSVGVITYKGETVVLPITEIISENDFFDYEAKYLGKAKEVTPAEISNELKIKIEAEAKRVYELLQMTGFSRSEFIVMNDEPYLLEMNTTPGLSPASILPVQAQKAGISLMHLFGNALEEVLSKSKV